MLPLKDSDQRKKIEKRDKRYKIVKKLSLAPFTILQGARFPGLFLTRLEDRQMSDDITRVDTMDSAKKNSRVVDSLRGEATVILDKGEFKCYWNDAEFPDGSKVCDSGITYRCHMGSWLKLDIEC